MLKEGEVQIVGEVVFREKSKILDHGMDMGEGLHVQAFLEMVEEEGKCGMVERSGRIIRNVRPERLTRISRRRDEVRYMSGESIMDGDIVVEPYTWNIKEDVHTVHRHTGRTEYFLDSGGEKTYIELTPLVMDPDITYGSTIYEYWEDEGFVSDSMQHFFFIYRDAESDFNY